MSLILPQMLVALVALGMALAFVLADRSAPTSRALGAALGFLGLSIILNAVSFSHATPSSPVSGWLALPEAASLIAFLEWSLRVRRTLPARALDTRFGDYMLRAGQGAGLLYALLSLLFPRVRSEDFLFALNSTAALQRPGFWLFAAPILLASLTGLLATALLLNRRPDRAERIRVLALVAASPFLLSGFVLRVELASLSVMIGEMIFLVGSMQYYVLQGQRGQFMSRFLSSQVAELVRERGLEGAMQQNFLEITAVVSDLRGFTAYAQAHPSSRVIEVLRDYYDAAGQVVADYGGTIKDFAGDGILVLVGAPIPMPNHASVGLAIARRLRDTAREVTERWSSPGHRLGIGLGVASGFVTVGVIGSASRLEYTAVGPAVNLASRLCEHAGDGEILVDARTRELAVDELLELRPPIAVKGFADRVALFALPPSNAEPARAAAVDANSARPSLIAPG
ncbi:MAG: adenylate/guanylate cyclase protein [Nevskia sp.]|nr:adenylate/guanylate cyclase protein [Nevskia sp.]